MIISLKIACGLYLATAYIRKNTVMSYRGNPLFFSVFTFGIQYMYLYVKHTVSGIGWQHCPTYLSTFENFPGVESALFTIST